LKAGGYESLLPSFMFSTLTSLVSRATILLPCGARAASCDAADRSHAMATVVRRGKTFHVKFYYQGRQYWKSLKTGDPRDARHASALVERTVHLLETGALAIPPGQDPVTFIVSGGRQTRPAPPGATRVTCEELRDTYLRSARARRAPTSFVTEEIHLRHFLQFLGQRAKRPADAVGAAAVEAYVADRATKVAPNTVNKELQTIRQMFTFGVEMGACRENPAARVQRLKQSGKAHRFMTKKEIDQAIERGGLSDGEIRELRRFRYLRPEEIEELLALARDSYLHVFLAVLAYTGMRRGEALALEWSDIDFEAKVISVNSRKQSRTRAYTPREIEMHEALASILLSHRERQPKGRYVFAGEDLVPLSADRAWPDFKRLTKGTAFEGIGFHALRHSFSSNLARAGVDDRIIDHFMGHQTEEMRRRYQHLFPEKKRQALSRLEY
jgi:integrase